MIFDLQFGSKRVYLEETGENLIGTLSVDSDLTSFHLEPEPSVADGINPLVIYGSNATGGVTAVNVTWYDRFTGN